MKRVSVYISAFILLGVFLFLIGCSPPKREGFAIYLTKGDIPPAQMPALSRADIADQPVIGMNDIITYNAQTHELKLTTGAYERIVQLEVPVRGTSFMVCIDRQPIYAGAFWTPISSISYSGVTIWKPLTTSEPHIVTFELGYPSSSFYGGEDPRNSLEIIDLLKQAGKLIDKLTITSINKLPHSGAGYELYSWSENSQWHFTLITGTDRNKTPDEIIATDDFISEVGWVRINVEGVDAIKTVLSKLLEGEYVSWMGGLQEQTSSGGVNILLPPASTVNDIKTYAGQCGLTFVTPTY